jgi:predicted acetyltransferase
MENMNIKIDSIKYSEKEILRNLLEKYLYEFSQYEKTDINELGLYGYNYLDCYWTENNRWAYFIKINNRIIGFALVNDYPEIKIETDFSMAEFFIVYKYRHLGIGKCCTNYLFNKHKGKWHIKYHPENKVSKLFWTNVVREYTKENYKIYKNEEDTEYEDGTRGHVLVFET